MVLGEFAKYAFCGLNRKRRNFERSVPEQFHFEIALVTAKAGTRREGISAIYLRG